MAQRNSTGVLQRIRALLNRHDTELERRRARKEEELFDNMEKIVATKGLYRNRSLSAELLARELCTNRLYLSRALSSRGFRFTSHINTFRLQKAVQLLSMPEYRDLPMDEVALHSGFGSDRTMNYYMKKMLGVSASVLRRRLADMPPDA